jgi:hypothetical protein
MSTAGQRVAELRHLLDLPISAVAGKTPQAAEE